ncbi:hypothetical protein KUTeg_017480 [Tegillarca granosa]|uniref:Uncharacterized protein n=1 Tax=Tegillarca granosa TaxID=220873 RepID=A0ABQ9EJZ0_TEGGR|nr:hypothetical protein KUTeg_017480 [Tegillarca granosa]
MLANLLKEIHCKTMSLEAKWLNYSLSIVPMKDINRTLLKSQCNCPTNHKKEKNISVVPGSKLFREKVDHYHKSK